MDRITPDSVKVARRHRRRYPVGMHSTKAGYVLSLVVLVGGLLPPSSASARSFEDCKLRWGSAVRSYLTQNRRAGPDGKVPTNIDETEAVAAAWVDLFGPACKLETTGKKREARLMAATVGTATLARLDPVACQRFLHYFMSAKNPEGVCQTALDASPERLKARVAAALKHRRRLNVPWVSGRRSN